MNEIPRSSGLRAPRAASLASAVHIEPRLVSECVMPVRFRVTLQLAECASLIGPLISLQSSLVLPGLQARITFRDRPHRDDVPYQETTVVVPLVLPGERLERPLLSMRSAPARGSLVLRLCDGNRQPLVPARVIECVAGSRQLEVPILLDVSAMVRLSVHGASASVGPRVHVNGKLVFLRGITAHISPGSGAVESARDRAAPGVALVIPGSMFFFYERTVESGLPGDPWVSVRLLDERGAPIGEERPVGLFHAA